MYYIPFVKLSATKYFFPDTNILFYTSFYDIR